MNAEPARFPSALAAPSPSGSPGEQLSALVDGELDVAELDAVLQALAEDDGCATTCLHYHQIGDLIRGAAPSQGASPSTFVSGVRARLQAEQPQPASAAPQRVVVEAANDAVFRWKLVAGLASVAAVMAVGWSLLGLVPGAASDVSGQQLAQRAPGAAAVMTVAGTSPSGAVVVNTPQGPVIRDVRLEELLAEHRQYGGMSALQMPAGFLRDATHQNEPRR